MQHNSPKDEANGEHSEAEKAPELHEITTVIRVPNVPKEQREFSSNESSNQGKTILTAADCPEALGYAFSTCKKWKILAVIFLVQCSMNFNASLYSNGLTGMSEEFVITVQDARSGAAIFLITYAFGCEL
jgi:hypothetical protein